MADIDALQEEHGVIRYAWMMRQAETLPWVGILLADDWLPIESYMPGADFVYVKYCGRVADHPSLAVARRGWHENSHWYGPSGRPLPIYPIRWKPLPADGVSIGDRSKWLFGDPNEGRYVRPAEPVYPAGGVDTRLTPVPHNLLLALHDGAVLHERSWNWTSWTLRRPGAEPEKLASRGVDRLREVAFIARDGVLPVPGRLDRFYDFEWYVTEAGKAWIRSNKKYGVTKGGK